MEFCELWTIFLYNISGQNKGWHFKNTIKTRFHPSGIGIYKNTAFLIKFFVTICYQKLYRVKQILSGPHFYVINEINMDITFFRANFFITVDLNESSTLHCIHAEVIACGLTFWMSVILSPFSINRPKAFLDFVLMWNSSASSSTKFIYSSKPTMWPSKRRFTFSYNHTWTRDLVCKYLKMRLIGCTITFWTFCGPLYAILRLFCSGLQFEAVL